MKKIINSLKRTHWFKTSVAFLTCLLFLFFPSCQKDELNQNSIPDMDVISSSALSASSSAKVYWGYSYFRNDGGGSGWNGGAWIETTRYFENFGNFVLNVQNDNGGFAKISTLEIRINNVLIVTAKGLSRDYFVAKTLRSLSNGANLTVAMEGDPGCAIKVWIEATFKGLGTAYGKHLYYKSVQNKDFWDANNYCGWFGGHLVIINNAKENNFVWNLCKNGNYFMGLSDIDRESVWRWVDGPLCRVLNWNWAQCPDGPIQWGNTGCTLITDYGYNNWANGQPDNCGGYNCEFAQNVAVFNNDGTWDDRSPGQGNFVIEWEYMPNSGVINNLFRQEYPEYPYPW